MVTKFEIERFMHSYCVDAYNKPITARDYTIAQDMSVQVDTDCNIRRKVPGHILPFPITHVHGEFVVSGAVTSLKNGPHYVESIYICSDCSLTNLKYAPADVPMFVCSNNKLTSLEGAPHNCSTLDCSNNVLTNLTSAPPCTLLIACGNPLEHLRDIPNHVKRLQISFDMHLPLLAALHLTEIEVVDQEFNPVVQLNEILKKYAGATKAGTLKCAGELILAGFKENARW